MNDDIAPVLRWLLITFRIFGYCPVSINGKEHSNRLCRCWSIILIASLNMLVVVVFFNASTFLCTEDSFGLFNDYLKLSVTILSLNISAGQSLAMKHYELHFWTLYSKLRSYQNSNVNEQSLRSQLREHKQFILKVILVAVSHILAYISISSYLHATLKFKLFMAVFTPCLITAAVRNFQFLLYMDLIRIGTESLDKELANLVEFNERPSGSFPHFGEFIRRRIVEKQKIYQMIYEMNQSFQAACNWSMFAHLLMAYTRIVVESYFCIWLGLKNSNPLQDILLVPAILEIPMFLLTAKSCMNAAKYISFRVHNLKHRAENIATSIQIQNFSLQLLHQKIKIDGLGIASMDGYMLTKAIGSITTYMVFFIQFMPKFKSKFD